MDAAVQRPERKPLRSLAELRTQPLDRLTVTDVASVVDRVMAVHLDQARVPAAKFSSHI